MFLSLSVLFLCLYYMLVSTISIETGGSLHVFDYVQTFELKDTSHSDQVTIYMHTQCLASDDKAVNQIPMVYVFIHFQRIQLVCTVQQTQ